jgi:hypothetical protein
MQRKHQNQVTKAGLVYTVQHADVVTLEANNKLHAATSLATLDGTPAPALQQVPCN